MIYTLYITYNIFIFIYYIIYVFIYVYIYYICIYIILYIHVQIAQNDGNRKTELSHQKAIAASNNYIYKFTSKLNIGIPED